MSAAAVATKPSALSTIIGLAASKKNSGPLLNSDPAGDPAIENASRDRNVVKLGLDPNFTEVARRSAQIKTNILSLSAEFETYQSQIRDYGVKKRDTYNTQFRTNVTTVCIPFASDVEKDSGIPTLSSETCWVQVVCAHRFTVTKDMVLANKDRIGKENYDQLFVESKTKYLKSNVEELFRNLLVEVGVKSEDVDATMSQLFTEEVEVQASPTYEKDLKNMPAEVQSLLQQMVKRASPAVKFQA